MTINEEDLQLQVGSEPPGSDYKADNRDIAAGHSDDYLVIVLLYPEESWARSAASSYWTLASCWWCKSRCKVVEVAGTRRYSTRAKMIDSGSGNVYIIGSFKKMAVDPDFKLSLTTNVSVADFNMGYAMTGSLERGSKDTNSFQMTHFAVIRRMELERPL